MVKWYHTALWRQDSWFESRSGRILKRKEISFATADLILVYPGEKTINVIKEIRNITDLGLKQTKDLVMAPMPAVIKKGVTLSRKRDEQ